MLVDELLPLEEILFAGHTGVVMRLLQAVVCCPEKQASLLQELLKAFHTENAPHDCVPLFLSLTTSEIRYGVKDEEGEGEGEGVKDEEGEGVKKGEEAGTQEGEQKEEVGHL